MRRRSWTGQLVLLVLIVVLAAAVRLYYVQLFAAGGTPAPLQVQAGESLSEETAPPRADAAPLYRWLVAQLGAPLDEPATLLPRIRLAQCALGALTAGLLFLFARRAFQSVPVATLAGLMAAVHPFWIVAPSEVADGVLAGFLLALALYLAARSRFQELIASWLFGAALAGLALTRTALLPFSLVGILWFLHRCRRGEGRTAPAVIALVGFASGLAPVVIRNYENYHDIVPIVDAAYYHLWIGNHPGATGGPFTAVKEEEPPDGVPPVPVPEVQPPPPTVRERAEEVRDTIQTDPAGTVERRLWAGVCFVFGEDWLTRKQLFRADNSIPEREVEDFRTFLGGSLLFLLVLGSLGWRWTLDSPGSALAALAVILIPLPYVVGHAEALSGPRLPLDGVLICLSAFAVVRLFAGLGAIVRPARG